MQLRGWPGRLNIREVRLIHIGKVVRVEHLHKHQPKPQVGPGANLTANAKLQLQWIRDQSARWPFSPTSHRVVHAQVKDLAQGPKVGRSQESTEKHQWPQVATNKWHEFFSYNMALIPLGFSQKQGFWFLAKELNTGTTGRMIQKVLASGSCAWTYLRFEMLYLWVRCLVDMNLSIRMM